MQVRIWSNQGNESLWQPLSVLEGHTNTVTGIAWSPNGDMLVSSSFDKTVRLWGVKPGATSNRFHSLGVWSAYSCPTMAVAWAIKPFQTTTDGGSMICIATMNSPTFLMDASDAGQSFITNARAHHTLKQGTPPLPFPRLPQLPLDFMFETWRISIPGAALTRPLPAAHRSCHLGRALGHGERLA